MFIIRIKPKTKKKKKKILFTGLNTSVLVLFSKSLVFKFCLVFEFAKSSFGIWIRIWGYNLRSTYRQHDEQADGGLHIVADGDDDDDDDDEL